MPSDLAMSLPKAALTVFRCSPSSRWTAYLLTHTKLYLPDYFPVKLMIPSLMSSIIFSLQLLQSAHTMIK